MSCRYSRISPTYQQQYETVSKMNTIDTTANAPFLHYVAADMLKRYGEDMSGLIVVFPNKRASLFLNDYLARLNGRPVWAPQYTTINELFCAHTSLTVADEIKLICELYKSFVSCTKREEPLDQFYGWGSIILSDFDDIDKSMANPTAVFSNVKDIHASDHLDYLTEEQVNVLKHFFKDFDENQSQKLKERFLVLWSKLAIIYQDYNLRLRQQDIAYEGALYRSVIEDEACDFGNYQYLFVGFNALQEVERQLFRKLKKEGQAAFYWDYDQYYMGVHNGIPHEAGELVRKFMTEFPNQLADTDIYDHLGKEKHIEYIGAPTENIQARYVGKWLSQDDRAKAANRTAVVLCNEALLPTVVHCIPEQVKEVNITTGFPINLTPSASLVAHLTDLMMYGRAGQKKYRQKFVTALLRHPYAAYISPKAAALCEQLSADHHYFPTREELSVDEGLQLLFTDLSISEDENVEYDINRRVNKWILDLLKRVAVSMRQTQPSDPLANESLFRTYTLVNRMQTLIEDGDLKVDSVTYVRLLRQVMAATTVPFHGEPATGVQVMGVLETRNLDFDHLLILSCGEGNMPKGLEAPSLIPYSIRSAFGLTTNEHKSAIYAYYFYRMIQRATDVTIMYGNVADKKNTGEMSRFMLQFMVESDYHIIRKSLSSSQLPTIRERPAIEKTEKVLQRLNSFDYLSPTAISRYLRCPLIFYYNRVAGIREPIDDSLDIDGRTFGNIFHESIQSIYESITGVSPDHSDARKIFKNEGFKIEKQHIENVLQNPQLIERCLDEAIVKHLFNGDSKPMKELNGLQIINRNVMLIYLKRLLSIDKELAPFVLRGHEGEVYDQVIITTSEGPKSIRIGGRIDRLDETTSADGQTRIRVVDYKTGSKKISALENLEAVFDPEKIDKHSDYYLQAMLYALIVSKDKTINPHQLPVSPALLFIQRSGTPDYSPILKFSSKNSKMEINNIADYDKEFLERLSALVGEIFNPDKAFEPTPHIKRCGSCVYAKICGQMKRKEAHPN